MKTKFLLLMFMLLTGSVFAQIGPDGDDPAPIYEPCYVYCYDSEGNVISSQEVDCKTGEVVNNYADLSAELSETSTTTAKEEQRQLILKSWPELIKSAKENGFTLTGIYYSEQAATWLPVTLNKDGTSTMQKKAVGDCSGMGCEYGCCEICFGYNGGFNEMCFNYCCECEEDQ